MRLVANFTPTSLITILAIMLLAPSVIVASEAQAVSGGADPSEFLAPDGRFDLEAARQAGFEGSLNLEGFDVRLDPETGEPVISPAGTSDVNADPDDQYWHDLSVPDVGMNYTVYSLTVYNGDLIAGGYFTTAGGITANFIARWDKPASSCCVIRGDVDHSGVLPIDIADLVYLVDYMFNEGPAPACFDEGDVDASGVEPIDIADLVYLVDYMFNSGPLPTPCP